MPYCIDIFSMIRVANSLDPEQARHFVGPGLGPNCLCKHLQVCIDPLKANPYQSDESISNFRSVLLGL